MPNTAITISTAPQRETFKILLIFASSAVGWKRLLGSQASSTSHFTTLLSLQSLEQLSCPKRRLKAKDWLSTGVNRVVTSFYLLRAGIWWNASNLEILAFVYRFGIAEIARRAISAKRHST